MVKITIILLFAFTFNLYSLDSCFTKQEIINISKYITEIEEKNNIADTIIYEQEVQIERLQNIIEIDSILADNYKSQLKYMLENEALYKATIKEMEPKWYEDPKLWFIGGIISGFIISR